MLHTVEVHPRGSEALLDEHSVNHLSALLELMGGESSHSDGLSHDSLLGTITGLKRPRQRRALHGLPTIFIDHDLAALEAILNDPKQFSAYMTNSMTDEDLINGLSIRMMGPIIVDTPEPEALRALRPKRMVRWTDLDAEDSYAAVNVGGTRRGIAGRGIMQKMYVQLTMSTRSASQTSQKADYAQNNV
ncbi:hypothetical protein Slin14017_G112890 [Septoria linicola]|nr:hypothetical protein Slin14017_G112890 [Septoria linicola]